MFGNVRTAAAVLGALVIPGAGLAGNLEVAVLEGNTIVHYWAEPGKPRNRGGAIAKPAAGNGSLIQDRSGNLQILVREPAGVARYWAEPGKEWKRTEVVTKNAGGTASLVQRTP
jgi:hypothetical protein